MGLESAHNGFIQSTGSPGSPPASLAEMISRNKMLEGKRIRKIFWCFSFLVCTLIN